MARRFHIYYHFKLPPGRDGFVRVSIGCFGHCWVRLALEPGEHFEPRKDYSLEVLGWWGMIRRAEELEAIRGHLGPLITNYQGLSALDRATLAELYKASAGSSASSGMGLTRQTGNFLA